MPDLTPPVGPGSVLLGRYELGRVLGRGGLATAFLAHDHLWDTQVALKLIFGASPPLQQILHGEFSLLRAVYHPRLVQVHDFAVFTELAGSRSDPAPVAGSSAAIAPGSTTCLYTADLVEGVPIGEYAQGGSWERLREPLCDALEALCLLHGIGVRHGDIKPANILVDAQGRGTLIDLSCARWIAAPGDKPEARHRSEGSEHGPSGTPGFIAPELLAGASADGRADLYGVGVSLERLLPALADTPPPLASSLIARLTSERAGDRPAQVEEVLELLGREPSLVHPAASCLGRFVGRQAELATAEAAFDQLHRREPGVRVLHVRGTGGTGRTRLLAELKWIAQQRFAVLEVNPSAPNAVDRLLCSTAPSSAVPAGAAQATESIASLVERWSDIAGPQARPQVWLVDDAEDLDSPQLQLLRGVARLLDPSAPVLLVVASSPQLTIDAETLAQVDLPPLSALHVDRWVGDALSDDGRRHLVRLTGGVPAVVRHLLLQLAHGQLAEEDLASSRDGGDLDQRRVASIRRLSIDARRALGWVALADGRAQRSELDRARVDPTALSHLVASGFVDRHEGGYALVRAVEAGALLDALGPKLVRELHGELAESCRARRLADDGTDEDRARITATEVRSLACSGSAKRAATLLLASAALHDEAPRKWASAAMEVADRRPERDVQLVTAGLLRRAGQAGSALARLDAWEQGASDRTGAAPVALERGACHLELGDARAAVRQLQQAVAVATDDDSRARAGHLLARAHNKRGDYRDALREAEAAAVSTGANLALRADALETAGVALSFVGDWSSARQRLDEAAALAADLHDPRRQIRAWGNRALVAYNQGDLEAALEDYGRAFDLAERSGLGDQLATAALNYGTACHQAGRWNEGLRSYERGMRIAVALGQLGTETWLRFNVAKLHADLGQFDRAETAAARCDQAAERSGLAVLQIAADTVRAEVALARGELSQAGEILTRAQRGMSQHGSQREKAEVLIQQAELAAAEGKLDGAAERLDEAAALVAGDDARDVEVRLALSRASLALRAGHPSDAVPLAEQAGREADAMGHGDLAAEAQLTLARAWTEQNAPTLARDHRRRARQLWERSAAGLPDAARDAFWRHPRRSSVDEDDEEEGRGPSNGDRRAQKLSLLVAINQRLNSSLEAERVLELAMDAAIELTGAERGFVLLTAQGPPQSGSAPAVQVGVARNLDREQLGSSHLKFSTGIAERVIATEKAVITSDATSDDRFRAEASVHAMHLKSVVCVPVSAPAGTLGALYLDNRFERGRFTPADVELLLAFANQVAMALTNARLHDELSKRNRQLEAERRRVELLLEGQAAEIDRLTDEVELKTIARTHRFDYSAIIGTSRPMQDLFALLDRVIDTALPLLIQGESGTGKELVARAIHHNSPQRAGRLVSINCGAVPPNLLESELFGYERGAFTGADRAREGLIVQARDGTLFLDEIGEMPAAMQVKLLRVLQERQVQPLGSGQTVDVDFRLVCATNRRLRDEVAHGRFREDLYYRISTVEIDLPPLRERRDDIPPLCAHLLGQVSAQLGRPAAVLGGHGLRKLSAYDWPGNVRQLEHVLTKAVALAPTEQITSAELDLPRPEQRPDQRLSRDSYRRAEIERIAQALADNRWNIAKTARQLGIPRATLYRRIQRGGLKSPSTP